MKNMELESFVAVGEFEEQESVLLIWPVEECSAKGYCVDDVSVEVVWHLMNNVDVIIVCFNEMVRMRAIEKLKSWNVSIEKICFWEYPAEIVYPRDFGAEIIRNAKGERKRVSFRFNEYAIIPEAFNIPDENLRAFASFHAKMAGVDDQIVSSFISEGGDREFNGNGVMMTIEETEVLKRNPGNTRQEVEDEFKRLFHLEKVVWLPRCTYDDENMVGGAIPGPDGKPAYRSASANGHIDEMCRFVAEDTVLLAEIPDEEAQKSELAMLNKQRMDEAYQVLRQATTVDGRPFRIVRMPVPDPIYIEIAPGDDIYNALTINGSMLGNRMLDGTPFPTGTVTVLPALSYCNFLITNGIVLAQKYYRPGMSESIHEKDKKALYILQQLFPDRKVVAIDTLALNILGGGIHCHTRNIPVGRRYPYGISLA